jgi:hypothetical protein
MESIKKNTYVRRPSGECDAPPQKVGDVWHFPLWHSDKPLIVDDKQKDILSGQRLYYKSAYNGKKGCVTYYDKQRIQNLARLLFAWLPPHSVVQFKDGNNHNYLPDNVTFRMTKARHRKDQKRKPAQISNNSGRHQSYVLNKITLDKWFAMSRAQLSRLHAAIRLQLYTDYANDLVHHHRRLAKLEAADTVLTNAWIMRRQSAANSWRVPEIVKMELIADMIAILRSSEMELPELAAELRREWLNNIENAILFKNHTERQSAWNMALLLTADIRVEHKHKKDAEIAARLIFGAYDPLSGLEVIELPGTIAQMI